MNYCPKSGRFYHSWIDSLIDLAILLAVALALLSSGCGSFEVRPITRVEYGRNTFDAKSSGDSTTEYGHAEGGVRLRSGGASLDFMVGPQSAWSDSKDPTIGANFNPRLLYFLDKDTFLHLETDLALYEDGDENLFAFFAVERTW